MASTHTPARTKHGPDAAGSKSWLGPKGKPDALLRGRGARRRLPHLLVGALLVVLCVGGAIWWSGSTQNRVPVLAIARPVDVGDILQRADLRSADVSASADVATVPVDRAAAMVGRPMATSLAPGALLTPASVGSATIPAAGRSVTAVGLKPGHFPPELSPGAPVTAVITAGGATGTPAKTPAQREQGTSWPATVVGIAPAGAGQTTVLSLELASAAAAQLAQVPAEQVALVLQHAGGER